MNFSDALKRIKLGERMFRKGWNGANMFIFMVAGSTFEVNRKPLLGIYPRGTQITYQPHVDMVTANGSVVPWLASQGDIFADDWAVKQS